MKTTSTLRQLLRQPGIIVAPGAYDCLTARLIEREGFPAVYMTGAGTAVTRVGKPDLGFASLTEMLANASAMASLLGDMVSVVDLFNLMGLQESLALDAKWIGNAAAPPVERQTSARARAHRAHP